MPNFAPPVHQELAVVQKKGEFVTRLHFAELNQQQFLFLQYWAKFFVEVVFITISEKHAEIKRYSSPNAYHKIQSPDVYREGVGLVLDTSCVHDNIIISGSLLYSHTILLTLSRTSDSIVRPVTHLAGNSL